jgi:ribosome-binding factor A
MIKKDVTFGDWRIVRHDDSKMEVYKNGELCPKSAPALREIAEEVGLEVNPDWRTSQLGSNVIKAVEAVLECEEEPALNNDNSMETEYDFPISDKLKEIVKNINDNSKSIRFELGNRVRHQLRIIPELKFFVDDSLDYVERIDELLKK